MDAVLPCSLRTAHSPDEAARQPLASLPSSAGVAIEAARGEPQDTSASDTRTTQPYVGQKNIQHTVHYTELASGRFKDFWKD